MRLHELHEGVVSAARGRIVNTKNNIAIFLSNAIIDMGFERPDVDFADSTSDDAIIYIDISGYIVMIRIIGDDDIKIQVPEDLANIAHLHDYQKLDGPRGVVRALDLIRTFIRERLIDRM
jgi:hypothetical protein